MSLKLLIDSNARQEDLKVISFLQQHFPKNDICIVASGNTEGTVRAYETLQNLSAFPVLKGADSPYAPLTPCGNTDVVQDTGHTVQEIYRFLSEGDKADVLLTSGATDLAYVLNAYPDIRDRIGRIIFVGGCYRFGDVTPVAEKNAYYDPEGLQMIFHSGAECFMIPLELRESTGISGSELGLYALLHPEWFTFVKYKTEVESYAEYTRGMTVIYRNGLDHCEIEDNETAGTIPRYVKEADKNVYYPEAVDPDTALLLEGQEVCHA